MIAVTSKPVRFEPRGGLIHGPHLRPWLPLLLIVCIGLLVIGVAVALLSVSGDLDERASRTECLKLSNQDYVYENPNCAVGKRRGQSR